MHIWYINNVYAQHLGIDVSINCNYIPAFSLKTAQGLGCSLFEHPSASCMRTAGCPGSRIPGVMHDRIEQDRSAATPHDTTDATSHPYGAGQNSPAASAPGRPHRAPKEPLPTRSQGAPLPAISPRTGLTPSISTTRTACRPQPGTKCRPPHGWPLHKQLLKMCLI